MALAATLTATDCVYFCQKYVNKVRLEVLDNHGKNAYTCLYHMWEPCPSHFSTRSTSVFAVKSNAARLNRRMYGAKEE